MAGYGGLPDPSRPFGWETPNPIAPKLFTPGQSFHPGNLFPTVVKPGDPIGPGMPVLGSTNYPPPGPTNPNMYPRSSSSGGPQFPSMDAGNWGASGNWDGNIGTSMFPGYGGDVHPEVSMSDNYRMPTSNMLLPGGQPFGTLTAQDAVQNSPQNDILDGGQIIHTFVGRDGIPDAIVKTKDGTYTNLSAMLEGDVVDQSKGADGVYRLSAEPSQEQLKQIYDTLVLHHQQKGRR